MNIFIAGGAGAIGRLLVPLLVNARHKVVALARSEERASQIEQMGAVPVIGVVYDAVGLAQLIAQSEAQVVMHQRTAFGTQSGDPLRGNDPRSHRRNAQSHRCGQGRCRAPMHTTSLTTRGCD